MLGIQFAEDFFFIYRTPDWLSGDRELPLTAFAISLVASVFAVSLTVTHNVLRQTHAVATAPLVVLAT